MQQHYELTLPSDRSALQRVEQFLTSIPAIAALGEMQRFNLIVATLEAVTNAIVHGKSAQSLPVELRVVVDDEAITICVRDYGTGFDPEAVPDPRRAENLLRESGRGVFLMRSLMDEVQFLRQSPGMEVVMRMRRS